MLYPRRIAGALYGRTPFGPPVARYAWANRWSSPDPFAATIDVASLVTCSPRFCRYPVLEVLGNRGSRRNSLPTDPNGVRPAHRRQHAEHVARACRPRPTFERHGRTMLKPRRVRRIARAIPESPGSVGIARTQRSRAIRQTRRRFPVSRESAAAGGPRDGSAPRVPLHFMDELVDSSESRSTCN
jgi:hypothetical protein